MKIKSFIAYILLIFISNIINAQTLYVIHKKGILFNKTSGKEIKQGDVIKESDKIKFSDKNASAVLISTKTGRFVVKAKQNESSSELSYLVSQVITPINQSYGLNTRSIGNHIVNLHDYFGTKSFLIWDTVHSIVLDENQYKLNDKSYFVFSYKLNQKDVNKKIASEGNNVLIEPDILYGQILNTTDSLPKATIYFINGSKEDVKEIVGFKPIYKPKSELISEFQLLNQIYLKEKLTKAKIKLKLVEYINSVYGKCDLNKLDLLLNEIIK